MLNIPDNVSNTNSPVAISEKNAVLKISMSSPGNMNALSLEMMVGIANALDSANQDPDIKVILITGSAYIFCAGHDLKELTQHRSDDDGGKQFFATTMKACSELMQKIVLLPKPVIAVVNGVATAAGCQLVASCDLAISSDRATFCTPGVNIGLFCSTPMVALSRNIPRKHAMEMLLTGDDVDAATAYSYGLINRIVSDGDLEIFSQKFAESIAKKSGIVLKIGKEAYYRQLELNLADAYDYCAEVMVENMMKNDAQEGIDAFLQKRNPQWTDS